MFRFVAPRRAFYSAASILVGSVTPALAQTANFNLLSQPAVNA
jgi:hypothetical protein